VGPTAAEGGAWGAASTRRARASWWRV